jgi:hypothetical protein
MDIGELMNLRTLVCATLLGSFSLFAQYKTEPAAAMPQGVPSTLAGVLQKEGVKITGADGKVLAEVWMRTTPPPSTTVAEDTVTWNGVAQGAFIGLIHFPAKHADRRGQGINPGLYTMRLSFFPVNGDHQGVAPQRDFLLLSNAAEDTDPAATPNFNTLVDWSRKVSRTPHPAVLSMWKVESDFKAGFDKMGEADYVLQVKVGDTPIAIILIGKAEG